ncbi:MAG: 5'-methylthioadenosine/adenosylhomocysteine nucleosidase [Bacillota bacterium]
MQIGIIGAMDVEIELLQSDLNLEHQIQQANMTFLAGELQGEDVVLVKSGIGKVNAALCTQILIDRFGVEQIIFTGVAGAVSSQLDVGDIVISQDAVQHDLDASALGHQLGEVPNLDQIAFPADDQLVKLAVAAGEQLEAADDQIKIVVGRVLSGDQFIADHEEVDWLRETFAGDCAEMEGAAVGQACFLNQVPFVIIRSISDKADSSAEVDYSSFLKQAACRSYEIVERMLKQL